jgi:reactive intermediate/imine deaminase
MAKQVVQSPDAPAAIGPYSQAILVGNTLYMSGQIPLDPKTMQIVEGIEAQAHQVFRNLRAVAGAANATLDDIVKLSILLIDLGDFAKVNEIMATYLDAPYPARATYQVAALPRGARIEVEATLVVPPSAIGADPQTGWLQTFDQTKGQ